MARTKKESQAAAFKGTGFLSRLSVTWKVYSAVIVFCIGVIIEGCLLIQFYRQFTNRFMAEDRARQEILMTTQNIKTISPVLLSRCQTSLLAGTGLDVSDMLTRVNAEIKVLQTYQRKIPPINPLLESYQSLERRLKEKYQIGLTKEDYRKIRKMHQKFHGELAKFDKNQAFQPVSRIFIGDQAGIIGLLLVTFTLTIILPGWFLITALCSVVIPAKLMTERLEQVNDELFSLDLPVYSGEGLGKAGLMLKESLTQWNSVLTDSNHSIGRFDSLCKELVTEIRKTELFAIQLQKVAEEIVGNCKDQNRLIIEAKQQLSLLTKNSDALHRIPTKLVMMEEELKNELAVAEAQTKEVLRKPVQYQDESQEIAELAENLSKTSLQVDGVVAILKEVAERTELLAFNTAIQAARAGEKGLGFSVVAKEIAKLVDQSKKSSNRLSENLYRTREKNERILQLITGSTGNSQRSDTVYSEVNDICQQVFASARLSFAKMAQLTKVMETIFAASHALAKEANSIADFDIGMEINQSFELEILDYQLNVKEANRMAVKLQKISEELRVLAETKRWGPEDEKMAL